MKKVQHIDKRCHTLRIQHFCVSDGEAGLDIIHQICDCGIPIPIANDEHRCDVLMVMEEDVTDAFLNAATEAIDGVCIRVDDEELALDNIPENLRDSDKSSAMEDAVEHLGEALDHIRQAQEEIEQAING